MPSKIQKWFAIQTDHRTRAALAKAAPELATALKDIIHASDADDRDRLETAINHARALLKEVTP